MRKNFENCHDMLAISLQALADATKTRSFEKFSFSDEDDVFCFLALLLRTSSAFVLPKEAPVACEHQKRSFFVLSTIKNIWLFSSACSEPMKLAILQTCFSIFADRYTMKLRSFSHVSDGCLCSWGSVSICRWILRSCPSRRFQSPSQRRRRCGDLFNVFAFFDMSKNFRMHQFAFKPAFEAHFMALQHDAVPWMVKKKRTCQDCQKYASLFGTKG